MLGELEGGREDCIMAVVNAAQRLKLGLANRSNISSRVAWPATYTDAQLHDDLRQQYYFMNNNGLLLSYIDPASEIFLPLNPVPQWQYSFDPQRG
jgi:hypothetical protein